MNIVDNAELGSRILSHCSCISRGICCKKILSHIRFHAAADSGQFVGNYFCILGKVSLEVSRAEEVVQPARGLFRSFYIDRIGTRHSEMLDIRQLLVCKSGCTCCIQIQPHNSVRVAECYKLGEVGVDIVGIDVVVVCYSMGQTAVVRSQSEVRIVEVVGNQGVQSVEVVHNSAAGHCIAVGRVVPVDRKERVLALGRKDS